MKVESFHSGTGLGLNLCELYTGSYRQQRVYRDKQSTALTGRTWKPPGFLLQESSNIVRQSTDIWLHTQLCFYGGSVLLTFDSKSLNHKTE
jgi:hypothetical protein